LILLCYREPDDEKRRRERRRRAAELFEDRHGLHHTQHLHPRRSRREISSVLRREDTDLHSKEFHLIDEDQVTGRPLRGARVIQERTTTRGGRVVRSRRQREEEKDLDASKERNVLTLQPHRWK
jgi:hypothetical protein